MRDWIRFPAAAQKFSTTTFAQRIARLKCRTEDWVSVHRTAHELGMRTTATMMFGVGETFEQRVNHFEVVPQAAGRDRRIHRLYPLELPAAATRRWAAAAGMKRPRSSI